MLARHIVTWNLLFKGVIGGLIIALVAMGIVLVYRSSRVINFAVGNMGVPATALFAIMAGQARLAVLAGARRRVARRHAHRHGHRARGDPPAVPVATRHRARRDDRCRAAVRSRHARVARVPNRFAADAVPAAVHGRVASVPRHRRVARASCSCSSSSRSSRVGLWWLLGHTAFGDAVRASATNVDLARMTGISPKLVSTAVWSIAGFLVGGRGASSPRATRARPTSSTSAPTRCCAAWPPRSSAAWSRSRAPRSERS